MERQKLAGHAGIDHFKMIRYIAQGCQKGKSS